MLLIMCHCLCFVPYNEYDTFLYVPWFVYIYAMRFLKVTNLLHMILLASEVLDK